MKQPGPAFPHLPLTTSGYFRRDYDVHRRFLPGPLPVRLIHYYPRKTVRVDWPQGAVGCFSVCLILHGSGQYAIFGKTWRVQAPFIITLWPGVPLHFAPDRAWEEFSIAYHLRDLPRLVRWKIASKRRPCWPISQQLALHHHLNQIGPLLNPSDAFGQADRLDMACHQLIAETVLSHESHQIPGDNETAVKAIERDIVRRVPARPDLPQLAADHGLTYPTFRRLWARLYTLPPARYAVRVKIEEACRLLRETDLQVQQIAERLEFSDHFYFSKQFRRLVGLSATDYRRRRQL